jgi:hypothetical protein
MILRRTLALEPTHQSQALTTTMSPGVVIPQTVQRDHKNGGSEHNSCSTARCCKPSRWAIRPFGDSPRGLRYSFMNSAKKDVWDGRTGRVVCEETPQRPLCDIVPIRSWLRHSDGQPLLGTSADDQVRHIK